jgi:hypothetical protein
MAVTTRSRILVRTRVWGGLSDRGSTRTASERLRENWGTSVRVLSLFTRIDGHARFALPLELLADIPALSRADAAIRAEAERLKRAEAERLKRLHGEFARRVGEGDANAGSGAIDL